MAGVTLASEALLEVDDLAVEYRGNGPVIRALAGVSLTLRRGEVVGVVGESGSGKSTLAGAIMGLLPANGRIVNGRVRLEEISDLGSLSQEQFRRVRGARIAMIFQDPLTSLNPTFRIGTQMLDAQVAHREGRVGSRECKNCGAGPYRCWARSGSLILTEYYMHTHTSFPAGCGSG